MHLVCGVISHLPRQSARGDASADLVAPADGPFKSGILQISLHSLTLPVDAEAAEAAGLDNFAEDDVRKGLLPYVIFEYEKCQVSIEAFHGPIRPRRNTNVSWISQRQDWFGFNVSTQSKLTIYLIIKKHNTSGTEQLVTIGSTMLSSFIESSPSAQQVVDLQNGSGSISLSVFYTEKDVPPLEDSREWWSVSQRIGATDLLHVEKKDIGQKYAMKLIENTDVAAKFEIAHPFIAPLQLSFRAPGRLSLLSPLACRGYLFSHLQKNRRFNVDMSRLYAAELVCVIECLHDHGIEFASLRPEHILVDAFGHITVCRPDLFVLDPQKRGHILPGTPEIAAPELLLGQQPSPKMDWWSLGIFLYEMLTGLLPFYHSDPEEQRHRIINQKLTIGTSVSSDAADILMKLLEKDYTKRLGANGASEVKAHPFFQDVHWDGLLQRKCVAYFEPCHTNMPFQSLDMPQKGLETKKRCQVAGIIYEQVVFGDYKWWRPQEPVWDKTNNTTIMAEETDDDWEIAWNPASRRFYCHNRTTKETRLLNQPLTTESPLAVPDEVSCFTKRAIPSDRQRRSALATALKCGYSARVIEQLLEYPMELNTGALEYDYAGDVSLIADEIDGVGVMGYCQHPVLLTPLEWAVEHGNVDLVNIFLEKGADANYTIDVGEGPSLLKAVRRGNRRLVDILAKRTNRLSSTRALCLAVKLRDMTTVRMLLSAGVPGDFDRADAAGSTSAMHSLCFTNPLAIAAKIGDIDLVRLLLAHGADANADYHEMENWTREYTDRVETTPVHFRCGRPIQVAMEMGHVDIVKLLIEEGGADIWLPHTVSRFSCHACPIVPRNVYVRVTTELEEVAATVRLSPRESRNT